MIEKDENGRLCGHVQVEDQSKKGMLVDRYFILDLHEGKLKIYYDSPKNLPKTACTPCQEMDVNFISKVSDARKLRPKAGNCFCITEAGDQCFVVVPDENDMMMWIEKLNEACRIKVPQTESLTLLPSFSRNEVAGGVLITTQQSTDSGEDSFELNLPALSLPSFISGYATKQGAVRKNWKKRYFVLDTNGLSYYTNDQDKEPIKTICLADIHEARLVAGLHHPHRQNLFEVETRERTFNIQCESAKDSQEWISHINRHTQSVVNTEVLKQTEICSKPVPPQPSSSQEELKPSRAVWDEGSPLRAGDRRSKTNSRHSKKTWSLW